MNAKIRESAPSDAKIKRAEKKAVNSRNLPAPVCTCAAGGYRVVCSGQEELGVAPPVDSANIAVRVAIAVKAKET